jgi:hypothetical protein
MKMTLLYFDGCPSWQPALDNLRSAMKQEDFDIPINLTAVNSDKEAADLKFLGSPSFQIDGQDLWPEKRPSYSKNCRVYVTDEGLKGWPTVGMLREKIHPLKRSFP